ncbi:MAG: hypothetical protein ABI324_20230 [Ktedonobacteraceae bacterium]
MMMNNDQPTQPIPFTTMKHSQETQQERYRRLKTTADLTGKRLLFVYLEDQKKRNITAAGQ